MSSIGIKRVEFCVEPCHSDSSQWKETPEKILRIVKQLGIAVNSIHVPLLNVSPNIVREELRKVSTELTKRTIDLASYFGARFIVQHVSLIDSEMDLTLVPSQRNIFPDLDAITPYAASEGIKVALENVPSLVRRMVGNSAKELKDIVNLFQPDTIGICLDITHSIASGFDPLTALDEIDFNRLISIHASDNIKGQLIDQHLPIGEGNFPWSRLFEKLREQKYQGSFVIEVAGDSNEGEKMKYKAFFKGLILTAMVCLIFGGFSGLQAAEKITFKFGHVLQTDHPYHMMALKFKEELEKRNKNCVVNIFPAKQLGNERDLVEGLQLGSVDISTITSALTAGFVPGFKVFRLPFLFKDANHLFRVMDSDIGAKLTKDMEGAGLIKLGFVYGGSRDLYSRQPIRNLQELKGKKIRTMENKILVNTWNTLGVAQLQRQFPGEMCIPSVLKTRRPWRTPSGLCHFS
jgi:sugar phosphate isomerase/epimerase